MSTEHFDEVIKEGEEQLKKSIKVINEADIKFDAKYKKILLAL